ncbi:M1 family metallopeptidase [Lactobacillus johnsonii]|uniref:Aminopeptidase n=1 Tax=Lactobacillus johnsonii TaxID=33959 RepID=A0A9X6RVV4_LACJH|nr:M1 family metallopeptidase [Lactobacillus johnsonii]OYS01621.1 peptidase [Lactobacillus johnsonii]OYS06230.1 peptidase [Lactobacillus johnsonii]OYS06625.1 peptidase [Lactobacillus johnsonii]OYS06718.1 peptidase [Lactobacillus johnsonii]OYS12213.1 peptidase [Lactobacillus johnsonii]
MTEVKRFYETFHPEHYDIYLDISREKKRFHGKNVVIGEAQEELVKLNQKYLKITSVRVDQKKADFNYNDKDEVINIEAGKVGKMKIEVDFEGKLTDTMMGIYPSYYEVDGEKKQLIGTQFETTFARQAFPCVDEPEAKATFALAIKFDEKPGESIISNQPEEKFKDGVHYFKPTLRMSSYLVAFVFGDMQRKLTKTKSGVEIGVFATRAHQAKELDFALDIAKRSIEFFEDFYETPYPLEHSYQVALPDFSAGAMENWGCVTYREAYLLLDPDNTSLEMKQLVATVIAHELAHQWFGDLVTMKWWDNLWLNESFANMMEYVAIDALEPNWKIWEMFQTSEVPAALQRDATDGVQSVHVMVNDPAEIDALFDSAIVYAKGSRMLVMVRALLGDEALREGLKNYFAAHKYGNATGDDLWKALGEASGLDIGAIMHSWLEQPGYPVVNAKVEDGKLVLTQKQFFIGEGKEVGRKWQIPLNSNYAAVPKIMKDEKLVVGDYADLIADNGVPFRLNVGNNSDFIVKYDKTLLDDILNHIDELDAVDKLQLLQDFRLLAEGGHMSYADIVPLLPKFADSTSPIVNNALYRIMTTLRNFVTPDSKEEKDLKKLYNLLSEKQVKRLGLLPKAGESNDDNLTRPYVVAASLYADNDETINGLHTIYSENSDNLEGISADIRSAVLVNEVKNFGNMTLFDKLLKKYQETSDASLKQDLCAGITSTKMPEIIDAIVDDFENSEIIKPQDLRAWYRNVLANPFGQEQAWNWIRLEWPWLEATVGGDMEFATFITVTANIFHTEERLNQFKDFFEPKINTPGLTREIKMDTKVIETKVNLVKKEQAAVNAAIAKAVD